MVDWLPEIEGSYFKLDLEIGYSVVESKNQKNPYEWTAFIRVKDKKVVQNVSKLIDKVVFKVENN